VTGRAVVAVVGLFGYRRLAKKVEERL